MKSTGYFASAKRNSWCLTSKYILFSKLEPCSNLEWGNKALPGPPNQAEYNIFCQVLWPWALLLIWVLLLTFQSNAQNLSFFVPIYNKGEKTGSWLTENS